METRSKPSWSFWVVAVLGFVWSAMGCANYVSQTHPANFDSYPGVIQELIRLRPVWANAAFAIGVFAGAIGCLLMLMKRAVAVPVLAVSLLGVAVTFLHVLMAISQINGPLPITPTLMSLVVSAVLLLTAQAAKMRGWLT